MYIYSSLLCLFILISSITLLSSPKLYGLYTCTNPSIFSKILFKIIQMFCTLYITLTFLVMIQGTYYHKIIIKFDYIINLLIFLFYNLQEV